MRILTKMLFNATGSFYIGLKWSRIGCGKCRLDEHIPKLATVRLAMSL